MPVKKTNKPTKNKKTSHKSAKKTAPTKKTTVKVVEKRSGFSVTSLVLAIVGVVLSLTVIGLILGIPLCILAIIFGIIALVKKQKKGMAIAGLVISGLFTITISVLAIIGINFVRNNADTLLNPMMEFGQMIEEDPELAELMKDPQFSNEFEYLLKTRVQEKFGNMEDKDDVSFTEVFPTIFEEMESIIMELKAKYQSQ